MCLQFTISLKFLQQNICETSLTAKVIVSIIFSIKNIVFLKNIYVLIYNYIKKHSRMHQIAAFSFRGNMPPNPLAMCSKTGRPQIPSKMIPQCSGISRISFRGGGSKYFWKNGDICMARSPMQRVAKPSVC